MKSMMRELVVCGLLSAGMRLLVAQSVDPVKGPSSHKNEYILGTLYSLQSVKLDGWMHRGGDIAHGEAENLDTRNWALTEGRIESEGTTIWLRRVIEIPARVAGYGTIGSQISLRVNATADGELTRIVYVNGERVAMGEELAEPVVLTVSAIPGTKYTVAIKLLGGSGRITFSDASLVIRPPSGRPDPVRLHDELRSAEMLAGPGTKEEKAVDSAFRALDMAALARGDQSSFDASLLRASSELETIQPWLRKYEINLVGNSHIDAAWLWPKSETVDVVHRTFRTALQLMNEYPDYKFTQSTAQYLEWMGEKYPSLSADLTRRVKEGRWEIVGGMWVEPDLNMPGGESIVRQLLVGKRYIRQAFGVDVKVGWNPDSFGYSWQLPQIYKKAGIDYFVTQKMGWNDTTQLPLKLFWWESPDGSRVLTYFPSGYANQVDAVQMVKQLDQTRKLTGGEMQAMFLYGVGDHGGGPTRTNLDEAERLEQVAAYPTVKLETAENFFHAVEAHLNTAWSPAWNYRTLAAGKTQVPNSDSGLVSIPTWKDELYGEFHRGVFTTQSEHKHNMRASEEWLLDAEKVSTLAWLGGLTYPGAPLTEAWKKVLFNQFHDLAAGSGVGVIYKDAERDYESVQQTTDEITRNALAIVAAHVPTADHPGQAMLIFNSMGWRRSEIVEAAVRFAGRAPKWVSAIDGDGKPVAAEVLATDALTRLTRVRFEARDIPAMGYAVIYVTPVDFEPVSRISVNGLTLENEFIRISVDRESGCITDLVEKAVKKSTLQPGGCGGELQFFRDEPKHYDAWEIDSDFENHRIDVAPAADSVEVTERAGLCGAITVRKKWQSSVFTRTFRLCDGSHRVDVLNDIDWHETHILLKAAFPLSMSSDQATFEIPFGTIERPTTRNNPIEKAKFEVPALQWADVSDPQFGFSLLNADKYGYDVHGNLMRLTLLRSPTYPDPLADRGRHQFMFSLFPHVGSWRTALTMREAYDLNNPLRAIPTDRHDGTLPASWSFAEVKPANVILSAMKQAEDGTGIILRFYETEGRGTSVTIRVPEGASSAHEVNLMEQNPGTKESFSGKNTIVVPIGAYEIKTVQVVYNKRGVSFWHSGD